MKRDSWIENATDEAFELMKTYAHYLLDTGKMIRGTKYQFMPDKPFFKEYQFIYKTLVEWNEKRQI